MIGIDTNVLVRYLVQDNAKQCALATRLLESLTCDDPGFISQVVLAETVRVLEACYAADAAKIDEVVESLLRTEVICLQAAEIVWRALRRFRASRGDFADTLIAEVASDAGCHATFTFDHGAAKRAGMALLQ